MPFAAKLAIFWAGVGLLLFVLRMLPRTRIARLLTSAQGPVWQDGERRSAFLRRKARFALGWLAQLAVADALLVGLWSCDVLSKDEPTVTIVCGFACVIGTAMALLGAVLAALASLKHRLLGPDPTWTPPVQPAGDDESGYSDFEA